MQAKPEQTITHLVREIRRYVKQAGFSQVVIGVSGGVDSAVCLSLCTRALGGKNVTALLMPERGLTKKANVEDAIHLCNQLEVSYKIIPINSFIKPYQALTKNWKQTKLSFANIKPRIRANILYNYANAKCALVIGTGNKTEALLGYGTKYGDLACDVFIIADLYKTQLYDIAQALKIPSAFIQKQPSAELYPDQTDEGEIGASYPLLDAILMDLEKKVKYRELVKRYEKGPVDLVLLRIQANQHKTQFPPILKRS